MVELDWESEGLGGTMMGNWERHQETTHTLKYGCSPVDNGTIDALFAQRETGQL